MGVEFDVVVAGIIAVMRLMNASDPRGAYFGSEAIVRPGVAGIPSAVVARSFDRWKKT
jgi:hypothetical protein